MCIYIHIFPSSASVGWETHPENNKHAAPRSSFLRYHFPEKRTEFLGETADSRAGCQKSPKINLGHFVILESKKILKGSSGYRDTEVTLNRL